METAIRAEHVSIRYLTGDFKDIGLKETSLSASGNDVSHYGIAHLFLTSEYDNLRTFCSQIFSDSATQHACAACDDGNAVFDIE